MPPRDHITRIEPTAIQAKATAKVQKQVKEDLKKLEPVNAEKVIANNTIPASVHPKPGDIKPIDKDAKPTGAVVNPPTTPKE